MVFPVVMYGCESWTRKKAKCWTTDAFELWCWRRLLSVPWTARRSNQSILKEISPGCSLEGLMLKLKLQHFGLPMWRTDSFEKTLMLGKIEGRRRRGWQKMRWLNASTDWMKFSLSKLRGIGDGQGGLACCSPCGHKESDMTERLNRTERKCRFCCPCFTLYFKTLHIWRTIISWVVSPKRYVQVLTLRACKCDFSWKKDLGKCDQVKMRSLEWPVVQYDWCPCE